MTAEPVIVETLTEVEQNLPAPITDAPVATAPMSLGDIMELGNVLVRSGMFRSTVSAEQAVAKVLAGRELGLGPIASMTHVFVIDGKVGLSAGLIGSKIRQHADYNFRVPEGRGPGWPAATGLAVDQVPSEHGVRQSTDEWGTLVCTGRIWWIRLHTRRAGCERQD